MWGIKLATALCAIKHLVSLPGVMQLVAQTAATM